MQNAVDHAFPDGADGAPSEGHVRVIVRRREGELALDVVDDGVGLPPDFSLEDSRGLGLSIVHALGDQRAWRLDRDARRPRDAGQPAGAVETGGPGGVRDALSGLGDECRYDAARWRATQALRSLRRSSSVVPPQMPAPGCGQGELRGIRRDLARGTDPARRFDLF